MLQKVGMISYANRQISQLSGGQQQRIFLARALMQEAQIYFMDEPFAGIDAVTEQEIFILLQELQRERKTLVVVHHDLATVERYFDWVVVLNTCLIASGPTREVFQAETILRAYGTNYALLNEAARLKLYQAGLP
jgi:manganese/zinc/iron transport system ATP- binding protein